MHMDASLAHAAFHLNFCLLGCLAFAPAAAGRGHPSDTARVTGTVASGPQGWVAQGAGHTGKILGDFMGFTLPICPL